MFDLIEELDKSTSLLTVKRVAEMLCVSQRTLHRMIAKRAIPSVLMSGSRLFDPKVLHWWFVKKHPEALKARRQMNEAEIIKPAMRKPPLRRSVGSQQKLNPSSACSENVPNVYSKRAVYRTQRAKPGQKVVTSGGDTKRK